MIGLMIGITVALGCIALGLSLLVLNTPSASAPGGITKPGLSNSASQRRPQQGDQWTGNHLHGLGHGPARGH